MSSAQLTLAPAWRRRLYLPAYSVSDAARYAQVHPTTVSYWHYRGGRFGPVLPGRERGVALNYFELVEVAFVSTFRKLGVQLNRIRKAHAYYAQVFNAEHPFAVRRFLTEGVHVMLTMQETDPDPKLREVIVADEHGQMAWAPALGDRFAQFDYEHDVALIWHVRGQDSLVRIDPRVAFGAPMVKGIPTWILKGRCEAGEHVEEIADDFGLEKNEVLDGLKFEGIDLREAA